MCMGCSACSNACPSRAISMVEDWKGFLYPKIDKSKCVDCRLCQKVCPVNHEVGSFHFPESRAFVEANLNYLLSASSGGAFGVVARYVLSEKGVVYGAFMDDDYFVKYIGIDSEEDLKKLHGSKYVYANIGNIYQEVKVSLSMGRHVLFCGCPCQVAGLKCFLMKDYPHLLTMDLICHGVPSQPYFRDYVKDLLRRKAKNGITTFRFRWKQKTCCETQRKFYNEKTIYVGFHNKDYYMTYFLWGKSYRSGCYHCRYAGGTRPGDFTVGDFWNNKYTGILTNDTKGASLVLFNSQKSLSYIELFKEAGECKVVKSLTEAMGSDGGQLSHPSRYDIRCDLIYILWRLMGTRGPKLLFALESLR